MKEIIIAFDCDGTIVSNHGIMPGTPSHMRPPTPVNLPVIMLIQLFATYMKNAKVIVWSGGGKDYAEQIVHRYGLDKFVSACYGKDTYDETIDGKVDICFDDIHSCALADKNLIVKMK